MFFVIPRLILLKCDFMHEQESRDFGQRLNAQLTEELIQESSGFFLLSFLPQSMDGLRRHAKHVNVTPRETWVTREDSGHNWFPLQSRQSLPYFTLSSWCEERSCHSLSSPNFHFTHEVEWEERDSWTIYFISVASSFAFWKSLVDDTDCDCIPYKDNDVDNEALSNREAKEGIWWSDFPWNSGHWLHLLLQFLFSEWEECHLVSHVVLFLILDYNCRH